MANIKLQKSHRLRKRYLASAIFTRPSEWFDLANGLRQAVFTDSHYQLVGQFSILELNLKTRDFRVLCEVVGPKRELDLPNRPEIWDFEAMDVFKIALSSSPDLGHFEEIWEEAQRIYRALLASSSGHSMPFSEWAHLLVGGEKLELHFFKQKDYIHS